MINQLKNRLMNMVARVSIKELSEDDIQTASLSALPGEDLDEVERVQNYGFTSFVPDGAQGLMVSVGASRDHAIIISADLPLARKKVEKGEAAVYTQFDNFVYLKNDGSIDLKGSKVSIKNSSDDLVSLLVDLLTALSAVTVNTAIGPQPFVNLADFALIKAKIQSFME